MKKTGYVDLDDFITGLAHVCRGTADEKIHFIFNMYDTSHDNTVSKQELTTLLNQGMIKCHKVYFLFRFSSNFLLSFQSQNMC